MVLAPGDDLGDWLRFPVRIPSERGAQGLECSEARGVSWLQVPPWGLRDDAFLTVPPSPQENSEDDKKRGRSTDSEVSQVG